jgi:hypothetical protein
MLMQLFAALLVVGQQGSPFLISGHALQLQDSSSLAWTAL